VGVSVHVCVCIRTCVHHAHMCYQHISHISTSHIHTNCGHTPILECIFFEGHIKIIHGLHGWEETHQILLTKVSIIVSFSFLLA
jgi:hypothetical protein